MPVTPPPSSGGGGGSVVFYDEGSAIGTGTSLNFVGAGIAGTFSGGTAIATVTGGTAAGSIAVAADGAAIGTATVINFTNSGGTPSYSGGTATIPVTRKYHPDNQPTTAVAVGHEYNDGTHNSFTWAPSDPATNDVTTYPGFLFIKADSTTRYYNKAWSPGASDITFAACISVARQDDSGTSSIGLYVAGATGDDPQDMVLAQFQIGGAAAAFFDFYARNTGTFAQLGSNRSQGERDVAGDVYIRVVRVNAGPTWTAYFSFDGMTWYPMGTTSSKSLTVAAIGIRLGGDSQHLRVKWIRGWASQVEKVGS